MNNYLTKWPDGTISILSATSISELYLYLDEEGNPDAAEVYKLPRKFHLMTCIKKGKIDLDFNGELSASNLKKIIF
jgi:hypothetical protein